MQACAINETCGSFTPAPRLADRTTILCSNKFVSKKLSFQLQDIRHALVPLVDHHYLAVPRQPCVEEIRTGRLFAMRFKYFAVILAAAFFSIVLSQDMSAQGVIVPIVCDIRPCRPIPRPVPLPNALPVKSIKLTTNIDRQVAT